MVVPEVTTLAEARDAIRDLAEEVEKLSNELAWFKRQMFGSKTEHYIPEDNTPSLFPEEESPEPSKEVQTATVLFLVNSHSKKSLFLLTMGLAGRIPSSSPWGSLGAYFNKFNDSLGCFPLLF